MLLVVIPAAQRGILRLVKPAAQHLIGGVILHFRLSHRVPAGSLKQTSSAPS